jgi:hypothetical protein
MESIKLTDPENDEQMAQACANAVSVNRWQRQATTTDHSLSGLLQLRVLRFSFLQDGNVGVGVSPEGEEIPVRGLCPEPVARQCVGTSDFKLGKGSGYVVLHDTAVIQ